MQWLFVLGVSLDLAGALLISAAVFRTPAESREEAIPRWGPNLWSAIFREQEEARVRAGIWLLLAGFVLQLAGYLWSFESWLAAPAAAVAGATIILVFFGARRAVASRMPLTYPKTLDPPPGIPDERHNYCVATLDDVLTWRSEYVRRMLGRPLESGDEVVRVEVNGGRWIADCPRCGGSMIASPGLETVACISKCGSPSQSSSRPIAPRSRS